MENDSNDPIKKLEDFKLTNIAALLEWEKLASEAKHTLFKSLCHKPYLNECEPEFCGFRMTGACKYPAEYSKLKDKMSIP